MRRFLILSGILLLFMPALSRAEVTDRIVAIVNDEIVTLREVERFVAVEKKSPYSSMNEYTRSLRIREKLDAFVEGLLIGQQARKMKIDVTDKEVQETIENIKKQNMISESELKSQLQSDHIDYKEFVEGIRRSITRNKVLARSIAQEVSLDEKSLKDYYDSHAGDYVHEEYKLQDIFISAQRRDAADRAQRALDDLHQDKPFIEVAKEFSDEPSLSSEGEISFTKKEELMPELRQAVRLLIRGSYSNIVRTPFGFHILRLIETKRGDPAPFEAVKENIKATLFQIEAEKRYKTYIAKLRSSSYIEVKI